MYAPLTDCTHATIQAINRANNTPTFYAKKSATRRVSHDPYKEGLLSPEDSFQFNEELQGLSNEPSPITWDGQRSGSYPKDVKISRPLFSDANRSVEESDNSHNVSTTGATPMKGVGKIYVGGRPMPVRRQQNAKVQVVLRGSEETFSLRDAYAVWGLDVDMNELRGRFVIVEGDRGEDMGYIREVSEVADTEEPSFLHLPAVVRGANHFDVMQYDQLDALEADALEYCRACQDHVKVDSPFTIEAAVFQYDRKKLTLKYKSEDYVDFRELTRLLHNRYKCRIWMDQLNREARIDRREKEYHNNKRGNMRHRN